MTLLQFRLNLEINNIVSEIKPFYCFFLNPQNLPNLVFLVKNHQLFSYRPHLAELMHLGF